MISYKPLWKTLIDRNMRQTELREKANFSKPTLAKMNQNEYISLEIIDKKINEIKTLLFIFYFSL